MLVLCSALAIPPPPPLPEPDSDGDGVADWQDCEPDNPWIGQGLPEICDDGIDNDCDGETDEDELWTGLLYRDDDGDGFGFMLVEFAENIHACDIPADQVPRGNDCNDGDVTLNPSIVDDQCNRVDNDCDGIADNDSPHFEVYFRDYDGDGFGAGPSSGCFPEEGAQVLGDCDDFDDQIHPDAEEVFEDGIDQDCNGLDDQWPDEDNDGYDVLVDCDDFTISVNPGQQESCNGIDDDCDGEIDEICAIAPAVSDAGCGCTTIVPSQPWMGFLRRR